MNTPMTYEDLLEKQEFIKLLYDDVRIVDPVRKTILAGGKTLEIQSIDAEASDTPCHEIWDRGVLCHNCIAMRSINEDKSFIKVEYDGETPYLVTALPLSLQDRAVALELIRKVEDPEMLGDFQDRDRVRMREMLDKRNRELVTDPLTGLFNRRYIQERLPHDILISHLETRPMTLVMADIDYFKKVNDLHGHTAGDFILKKFAGLMRRHIRSDSDWVARFGGEEFLMLLNNTDSDAAHKIVERLRRAVEQADNIYEGKDIKITCSFGMHTFKGEEASLEELVRRADRNLYAAKEAGRNKIVRN